MSNEDDKKIIVVDFVKKQKEKDEGERKKKDVIIYGNIIKRLYAENLIPVNQEPEDEPA